MRFLIPFPVPRYVMKEEATKSDKKSRRPYAPPVVERVILDPIKEMLDACDINAGGKGAECERNGGFTFS
jgi:hypothetical protein